MLKVITMKPSKITTNKTNNSFLFRQNSQIHGIGIFTSQQINKGAVFYSVPFSNIYKSPKPNYAHIGENNFVDDAEVLNWVNHSCNPNTILEIKNSKPILVAKRNINANEEITVDYELTESNGEYEVKCNCCSSNCRGHFKIIV